MGQRLVLKQLCGAEVNLESHVGQRLILKSHVGQRLILKELCGAEVNLERVVWGRGKS